MKNYFPTSEFIACSNIKGHIITPKENQSIEFWQTALNPIRSMLGFPIKLTDWLRVHKGEKSRSQHYAGEWWSVKGAVDLRPSDRDNRDQFLRLSMLIAASPKIKRACYYVPSSRFPNGGFHLDCKGDEKVLFINEGRAINWKRVNEIEFIKAVKE